MSNVKTFALIIMTLSLGACGQQFASRYGDLNEAANAAKGAANEAADLEWDAIDDDRYADSPLVIDEDYDLQRSLASEKKKDSKGREVQPCRIQINGASTSTKRCQKDFTFESKSKCKADEKHLDAVEKRCGDVSSIIVTYHNIIPDGKYWKRDYEHVVKTTNLDGSKAKKKDPKPCAADFVGPCVSRENPPGPQPGPQPGPFVGPTAPKLKQKSFDVQLGMNDDDNHIWDVLNRTEASGVGNNAQIKKITFKETRSGDKKDHCHPQDRVRYKISNNKIKTEFRCKALFTIEAEWTE